MANRDSSLQIGATVVDEINRLHNGILGHARQSLDSAIRIGEILTQVKAAARHKEWLPWLEDNVAFNVRTAQRYMSCYERRDQFKNDNVSHLSEAYALIASNGTNGERGPQQLHESNFWSASIKLTQGLTGRINHELKDRPIDSWGRDKWVSLAAALEPLAELYARLKTLIG